MLLANVACLGPDGRTEWYDTRLPIDSLGGHNWAAVFHIWRMDWDEKCISLYVDDRLLNRVELEKLEIETASMRSRLPQDLQKSQFESSLRNAAATTAFKFGAAQWKPSATTSTHSRAEVTVTGNGSFASICKFLNEINQLARITKISSLALETSNESASYPLEVTFVLVYGIESNDTDRTGGVL